ncbi:TPA: restriction endonuclease subunit S [Morganella morganii subsp. morganii]|uniref:Restriction endonuclease n=1 Tax=Morganella morganii TaxID=582 RepID=A0AAU8ZKD0_MORMO|nr:restriction endonuclease subunit S [Morganella morganii]HBC6621982.1 restriction endonuclease subunit S [Proteus mirabilis]HDU8694013.1 restriction endonuclease subunit S [Morganella morganii subsp. morganii]AWC93308.1 restriction endonuclease [Morganella morganii]HAT3625611.1 restriction endonuclease subunit S [Morganella morganii]HDU8565759.1 restriction endonuclease subunit S [Morganella morganii]
MSELSYLEKLLDGVEVAWVPLEDIAKIYDGTHQTPKYTSSGVPFVSVQNIKNLYDTDKFISSEDFEKYKNKPRKHDLFMTRIGDVGTCAIVEDDKPLAYYVTLALIRVNQQIAVPGFIRHLIESGIGKAELYKRTLIHAVPMKINLGEIGKIVIPIPCPDNSEKSLAIQSEIVRILDAFTALTAELTAELTARKKQYNYYRDQLLSFDDGKVEWKTLGEIAENLDSKRKPITSGLRETGKIPYYGASGIVDYVRDYIFDGDYLLVSEDGANLIARNTPIAFSISGKTWVNNHAHVLKFETYAERKYVEYYLNSIDLTSYISGAAQPKLNKKNLENIKIPNPAPKEKERIVAILDKFDTLTSSITEGLPREIELRKKQYEYYRDLLFSFPKPESVNN